mgnify:CR=1 FL=1
MFFHKYAQMDDCFIYGDKLSNSNNLSHPLVLFSEIDGTALASLHFKSCEFDTGTVTTLSPVNDSKYVKFQGLINGDDKKFELVFTNLCPKGSINFVFTNTENKITDTNPNPNPRGIVLEPFDSYVFRCNDLNDLPLTLQRYRDSQGDDFFLDFRVYFTKNTEKESQRSRSSKCLNLYVVPEQDEEELVGLFKKTTWRVADLFPIKVNRNLEPEPEEYCINPNILFDYTAMNPCELELMIDEKIAPKYQYDPDDPDSWNQWYNKKRSDAIELMKKVFLKGSESKTLHKCNVCNNLVAINQNNN